MERLVSCPQFDPHYSLHQSEPLGTTIHVKGSIKEHRHQPTMKSLPRFLVALLMLAVAQVAVAGEITGRVVGIADGDTLTVLDAARQQTRVRLAEIDAPESHQPYGSRAKQALSDLAFGKSVRVVVQDTDRYGRTVGRIYAESPST
jgi:endonuclease YncB( thermonuclease family)